MRRGGLLALALLVVAGMFLWGRNQMTAPTTARDRPVSLDLPADRPLSIVVLGTSLSHGERWPDLLADRLASCLDHPVTMTVIARPGAASDWGMTQAQTVADLSPDLVMVEFAINDADMLDGVSLRQSRAHHAELVTDIRRQSPETRIVLMTMSPAHGLRGLVRPRLGAHYRQYRDLARALDLGLVDLYPRWLSRPRAERGMDDGLHPDPGTAAAVIVPPLADYLARAAGAPGCTPR